MKKIITLLCAVATLTACDIDRLPYGSMSAEQITQDPTSSLESHCKWMLCAIKKLVGSYASFRGICG